MILFLLNFVTATKKSDAVVASDQHFALLVLSRFISLHCMFISQGLPRGVFSFVDVSQTYLPNSWLPLFQSDQILFRPKKQIHNSGVKVMARLLPNILCNLFR